MPPRSTKILISPLCNKHLEICEILFKQNLAKIISRFFLKCEIARLELRKRTFSLEPHPNLANIRSK